jgi:hypothetical protein
MSKIFGVHAKLASTDWQAYTPVFTAFGTVTSIDMQWRREGSEVKIRGKFLTGTHTGVEARISLPIVNAVQLVSADISKIGSIQLLGLNARTDGATQVTICLIEPSTSYFVFSQSGQNMFTKANGTTFSSSNTYDVYFSCPIQGWSTLDIVPATP